MPKFVTGGNNRWPRWTAEEIAIVQQNYQALGAEATAALLPKRSVHSVIMRANKLGFHRRFKKWTREEDDLLRREYPSIGPRGCADKLGRPLTTVHSRAEKLKVRCRCRNKANPNARTRTLIFLAAWIANCTIEDLLSYKHELAPYRWRIAKHLRDVAGYSLPKIGQQLGRDHTSVLMGIRRLEQLDKAA